MRLMVTITSAVMFTGIVAVAASAGQARGSSAPAASESRPTTATAPAEPAAYSVRLPDEWKQHLSVGELIVTGSPFYSVRNKGGMMPVVPVRWSLKNLTDQALYFEVNFRSPNPKGEGATGMSVGYLLAPHERRQVYDVVTVFTANAPNTLQLRLEKLGLPDRHMDPPPHAPLTVGSVPTPATSPVICAPVVGRGDLCVKSARLTCTPEHGNQLAILVSNPTDRPRAIGVQVCVADPSKSDPPLAASPLARSGGSLGQKESVVEAHGEASLTVAYRVPTDAGDRLVLGYRVFERLTPASPQMVTRLGLTEQQLRRLDQPLIQAGCFDLQQAAAEGLADVPPALPVTERAKLTAQRESRHFLFHYRPDSYAAQNIERIVQVREAAYDRLSKMLKMELPVTVRIDLYPDMEAKAFGSKTTWTPANTVNNRHIAEVCNESYQCDAHHELAHIFTFHFGAEGNGLCEAFAVYCEGDWNREWMRGEVRRRLAEGTAGDPLALNAGGSAEAATFVDYLINRDVTLFKQFFVVSTTARDPEELEQAARKIYKTDLEGLRGQWRDSLSKESSPRTP